MASDANRLKRLLEMIVRNDQASVLSEAGSKPAGADFFTILFAVLDDNRPPSPVPSKAAAPLIIITQIHEDECADTLQGHVAKRP